MSHGERQDDAVAAAPPGALADGVAVPTRKRRRALQWFAGISLALAVLVGGALASLIYFNIENTPFVGRLVRDQLVSALQDRMDPALRLSIDDVDIQRHGHDTNVRIGNVTIRDADGRALLHAPSGMVKIATAPLVGLRIVPKGIVLDGLSADVAILENGGIAVSAADRNAEPQQPASQAAAAGSVPAQPPIKLLQQSISGLFAAVAGVRQTLGGRLPDIVVDRANIRLRDVRDGRDLTLTGLGGRMTTAESGATTATLAFSSGTPIGMAIHLSAPGPSQTLKVETDAVAISALLGSTGVFNPEARGTLSLEAEIDRDMQPSKAKARIAMGAAVLNVEPKAPPVPVENAVVALDWSAGANDIGITVDGLSDGSVLKLKGAVTPAPSDGEGWKIRLADAGTVLAPMTSGDKQVAFDALSADLTAFPERRTLMVDALNARIGQASADMSGEVIFEEAGGAGLSLDLKARSVDGRTAMRLWPIVAAPEVRKWVVDHVRGGELVSLDLATRMSADVLDDAVAGRALPVDAVKLTFAASRVTLLPAPGLPLVQNLAGKGLITGRAATIDLDGGSIDAGQGRRLVTGDGSFIVPDFAKAPADARLKLKITGPIEAALDVIKAPGIQAHLPKGVDRLKARGLLDGELNVGLKLVPKITPADTRVAFSAQLKNLAIDKGIGDEKIEAGVFDLNADRDAFSLKGDARLFGAPAAIEVKGTGKSPAVANVSLTLDDAARARRGINLAPAVVGPIIVKFTARLDGDNDDVVVDADLTRLAINQIVPGLAKKAGMPGRLRGVVRELENGGWALDRLELDAGGISARGMVQVSKDGGLAKANFASLKFAPGDAMQLEAERAGSVLRLNVRANSVDARPYLKSVLTGGIEKTGGRDVDLTLRTTVLSGFNGELVANADLKVAMRNGGLNGFSLTGRFDGGGVNARLQPGGGKNGTLTVLSDDAGAFLRFFDIYNRMRGGKLELSAALGNGSQQGGLVVRNFILRDEPALRRLVAQPEVQTSGGDTARLQQDFARSLRNGQEVPFTRMSVRFARTPGRLDLKDGVLIGPEIGGNIEGRLDYARDSADLHGTFVPAYSLNNALANVPLVGPIITGGRSEGLFAVRYAITGKASAPTLSVNPLTAIAPGFLRRLLDFRRSSEQ